MDEREKMAFVKIFPATLYREKNAILHTVLRMFGLSNILYKDTNI